MSAPDAVTEVREMVTESSKCVRDGKLNVRTTSTVTSIVVSLRTEGAVMDDFVSQVSGISALVEPARRALYLYVVAQQEPVSRDQAAEAAALPRHTAKFHLDRLVEEGLLHTEFRRLTGRRGPGAGRPSKLYYRSTRQVAVTLPERHYDLAAQILARAIEESISDGGSVRDAVRRAATDAGRLLGSGARGEARSAEPDSRLHAVADLLREQGYEPRVNEDEISLSNCPFDALSRQHTELVCGMNLDLITAMLERPEYADVRASLHPAPDRCCVTLTQPTS